MPRCKEVGSLSECMCSKGQENWVGIQFLIFITISRYWLLDRDSRLSTSGGAGRCPSASSDFFARLLARSQERRVHPARNRAAVAEHGLGGGVKERESFPGDFSQQGRNTQIWLI